MKNDYPMLLFADLPPLITCQKAIYQIIPTKFDTIMIVSFQMEHHLETAIISLTLYIV